MRRYAPNDGAGVVHGPYGVTHLLQAGASTRAPLIRGGCVAHLECARQRPRGGGSFMKELKLLGSRADGFRELPHSFALGPLMLLGWLATLVAFVLAVV